jgi:L-serine deaminase
VSWQLTTQGQAAIVRPSNRSVVSAGLTQFAEVGSGTGNGQLSAEAAGLNVHQFTDGYLIAVEQMFLGSEQTGLTSNTAVSVIMECTVETLTQSAAMALALSQQ